jgi:hypothetical protein
MRFPRLFLLDLMLCCIRNPGLWVSRDLFVQKLMFDKPVALLRPLPDRDVVRREWF